MSLGTGTFVYPGQIPALAGGESNFPVMELEKTLPDFPVPCPTSAWTPPGLEDASSGESDMIHLGKSLDLSPWNLKGNYKA